MLDCTTDTFWKCSERKECPKILKIPKNSLRNCSFFSNATPCSPEVLTSASTDSNKTVSFECFEIVRSLPEKGL